jgi:Leucine-rich repeat (LRR) protein
LRELDLNRNKIRTIEPNSFTNNEKLVCLRLEENGLKSLINVERCESLQALFLSGNRLQDFFELDRLDLLVHLMELVLQGNPLARKPNYRVMIVKRLASLVVLDGKEITLDERQRLEKQPTIDLKQQPLVHF